MQSGRQSEKDSEIWSESLQHYERKKARNQSIGNLAPWTASQKIVLARTLPALHRPDFDALERAAKLGLDTLKDWRFKRPTS